MLLKKVKEYVFVSLSLCICLLGRSIIGIAQELPPVNLQPIEIITKRLSPFAIGASTVNLDSTLLNLEATPNLADLITSYTSTSVKSYGNGMLSTVSFRGTGPSHTAVLWHGINISYPMLGQADLSLLSIALSERVTMQQGSGAALYGSGALGGTISLESSEPILGTNLSLAQWFGSFGTIKNNLRASYANDKFFIKFATLWDQSTNDFAFINSTKLGSPKEVQQGAEYKVFGTALELGIKMGEHGNLSISSQYFNADRNLQPSMNANIPSDRQTDENIRVRAKYQHNGTNINWNINYAYLHDVIGFNGAKTYADQQVLRAELERNLFSWLNFNLATDYNFIQVRSPFYAAEKTREERANIWASLLFNPLRRLLLSVNFRQSFNPLYEIPFVPSLGVEYLLIANAEHQLNIKTQASKGFRVPTLNEQYWRPGGNPNLKPEDSYSAEIGVSGKAIKGLRFSYELTGYRMWVDNWILWQPQGSFWSPENIKQVDVYGVEAGGSFEHKLAAANIKWLANYAFTRSINRTGLDQFDRSVNKQLAYVPIHRATISSITDWRTWSFLVNAAFTGQQFVTADNEESLPEYLLLNLRLGKSISKGKYIFKGYVMVNNLLNINYQSIENKAMPGINYVIGIRVSYYNP